MSERRTTFVDRVLDGDTRIDELAATIEGWMHGSRRSPLHVVLGLDAAELDLIASTPDALRYLLHARRFGPGVSPSELTQQQRVRDHSTRLACEVVDPRELAVLEAWRPRIDAEADHVRRGVHA